MFFPVSISYEPKSAAEAKSVKRTKLVQLLVLVAMFLPLPVVGTIDVLNRIF